MTDLDAWNAALVDVLLPEQSTAAAAVLFACSDEAVHVDLLTRRSCVHLRTR